MVEASPGPFMDLLIEYGNCERIELVCAAVATMHGLVRFHHSEAGVGTSNPHHYQKWRDSAKFDGRFWAPTIVLEDVVERFGHDFDFINIDIEGGSADLFARLLAHQHRMRPKCFCVEHDGRQEELTLMALTAGYVREHLNGENVIFARQ
jgi:FkbM family methyltransferase